LKSCPNTTQYVDEGFTYFLHCPIGIFENKKRTTTANGVSGCYCLLQELVVPSLFSSNSASSLSASLDPIRQHSWITMKGDYCMQIQPAQLSEGKRRNPESETFPRHCVGIDDDIVIPSDAPDFRYEAVVKAFDISM
jgi:hypothetical protein